MLGGWDRSGPLVPLPVAACCCDFGPLTPLPAKLALGMVARGVRIPKGVSPESMGDGEGILVHVLPVVVVCVDAPPPPPPPPAAAAAAAAEGRPLN